MNLTRQDLVDTLYIIDHRKNSNKIQTCNFIDIVTIILTFSLKEFFIDEKLVLPKFWNLFKWFRIAKFFIDAIKLIVSCVKGKKVTINELSDPFRDALNEREFEQSGTIDRLKIHH